MSPIECHRVVDRPPSVSEETGDVDQIRLGDRHTASYEDYLVPSHSMIRGEFQES